MRTEGVWSLNPFRSGSRAQSMGKAEAVIMSLLKSTTLAAHAQPEHTGQILPVQYKGFYS